MPCRPPATPGCRSPLARAVGGRRATANTIFDDFDRGSAYPPAIVRRTGQVLVVLAALLNFASAVLHGAFARPAVLASVSPNAGAETLATLNAAWILGTAALVAFGLLALLAVPALGRERVAVNVPLFAGLLFLGYGVWAFLYRHQNPHYVGFMVTGALYLAGTLFIARERVSN